MPNWKHFPLWDKRPEDIRKYRGKERATLELVIAYQISELLSRHGIVEECGVNVSASPDLDEPVTYEIVTLEPVHLKNDGELQIDQIPYSAYNGYLVDKGACSVTTEDEDGVLQLSLTVWEPSIDVPKRIHNERNKTVGRMVLQELHEALAVVLYRADLESSGNVPPLNVAAYPTPVIDPAFEAIIGQFD